MFKKTRMTRKEEVLLELNELIERNVRNIPHLDPKSENEHNDVWEDEDWTNEINVHLAETFKRTIEEYTRQKRKAYRLVHDIKELIQTNNMAEAVKEFSDEFIPYIEQIDSIKEKQSINEDLDNFIKHMSLSRLGSFSAKIEELFLLFDQVEDCGDFASIVDYRIYGTERIYWVKVFLQELHRSRGKEGKNCVPTLIHYLRYCK